jgi:site-specific recombinase XerD
VIGIRPRGKIYHLDGQSHELRGTLRTKSRDVALRLSHRIETALAEGPRSSIWTELRPAIPAGTFARLTKYAGVETKVTLTVRELRALFESHQNQRFKMNSLSSQTLENYQKTLNGFESFLAEQRIEMVQDITKSVIDDYGRWRIGQVKSSQSSGGGPSLYFDLCHLHCFFGFAVERELLEKNPVTVPARPRLERHISRPFTADEMARLEDTAKSDPGERHLFSVYNKWVPFWLSRWTGFRPSDAIALTWREVLLAAKRIQHQCHKNKKWVFIPVLDGEELAAVLQSEYESRTPLQSEPVLVHPVTRCAFTYGQFYDHIVELGRLADVPDANPDRFRGTFAVDMLLRTNNPYYVANLLGDTMKIVERHYMPYVRELQEHNRLIAQAGAGLRQFVTPPSHLESAKR